MYVDVDVDIFCNFSTSIEYACRYVGMCMLMYMYTYFWVCRYIFSVKEIEYYIYGDVWFLLAEVRDQVLHIFKLLKKRKKKKKEWGERSGMERKRKK